MLARFCESVILSVDTPEHSWGHSRRLPKCSGSLNAGRKEEFCFCIPLPQTPKLKDRT